MLEFSALISTWIYSLISDQDNSNSFGRTKNKETPLGSLCFHVISSVLLIRPYREKVRNSHDAETPGKRNPQFAPDRITRKQRADGIDDRRHRLMLRKGTHHRRHRLRRHKRRADERQEDQRIRERDGSVHALRRKPRNRREPRQRQRKQREDTRHREPAEHARRRTEAHQ